MIKTKAQPLRTIAGLLGIVSLLTVGAASAQERHTPSSVFTYNRPIVEDVGYMVAGDLWDTVRPMNTATPNGVEDPLASIRFLKWITLGPDGGNWLTPTGLWPGGYDITNSWRDGVRLLFPVYEAGGWPEYGPDNVIRANGGDVTDDDRFMFAYYSPNLQGTDDPTRNYNGPAQFTDRTRSHLFYEAGWPTTAGIDFKLEAHQYTINEQNLNDFIALQITMTNTGVVDTDGDGTPEETGHVIDALGIFLQGLPTTAVRIGNNGDRQANRGSKACSRGGVT